MREWERQLAVVPKLIERLSRARGRELEPVDGFVRLFEHDLKLGRELPV